MATASVSDSREKELWRRLGEVNDPELDEPITEMGFVERAEMTGDGSVEVDFRLPTYWCSPNFAFLMLDGVRKALDQLSWSPAYRVKLHDHMFAEEVNRGIEAGKAFGDIFAELAADADLGAVRETFRMKAFKRRQEAVLRGLRQHGLTDVEILGMDLPSYDAASFEPGEAAMQKPRYRAALLQRFPDRRMDDPVFVTWEGRQIPPAALSAHLAELRGVRVNMEFNGALCRGLKQTRYKELSVVEGEPTLVDFIMDRVPARNAPAV
ncbi:iron-sulfur cluster assembly protein [Mesorhizobium sp. CA18]|uniref:iron-sulfur cluster assembly protein n=1 Tax=unclassified Mesorhizobium TaxID=325217 RepID=UPI001CCAFA04|nr:MULTISPECIES: iron-sulfur cluster assembly protein [unclassified Mesorhizobium]MBZ9733547.1 iron-sulfur cluster assembly protein [Mesorhizobium sp. CA9]MBZ9824212.1 iron-sulfur cluster assembly protein [Mesorhizobium sp. CA18]MBZ9831302.1 iron-sulfur cluster assembly protein [Mesorhizobium sp. CA2]MBZ9837466.1 iron-sulfur cluster assembly protein [Mesorhizobium sp. CA3]MBZ9860217.1 iron-sulfur cluster assembly protein [Mesorhizobium sp. CA12]